MFLFKGAVLKNPIHFYLILLCECMYAWHWRMKLTGVQTDELWLNSTSQLTCLFIPYISFKRTKQNIVDLNDMSEQIDKAS